MKKVVMYLGAIVIILLITVLFLLFTDTDPQTSTNIKFLKSYNWVVDPEYIEKDEIIIPRVFDSMYQSYNELQKDAGLDLEPYKGMPAVRYTYTVKNYPADTDEPIRANVIVINAVPVGGDIMTVSFNGFMHSLNYPPASPSG